MTHITRKQTLRSLSMSYQKKNGPAWERPSFFGMRPTFREYNLWCQIQKSRCHTNRTMGMAMRAHPYFCMTTTKTLRYVFSWHASHQTEYDISTAGSVCIVSAFMDMNDMSFLQLKLWMMMLCWNVIFTWYDMPGSITFTWTMYYSTGFVLLFQVFLLWAGMYMYTFSYSLADSMTLNLCIVTCIFAVLVRIPCM